MARFREGNMKITNVLNLPAPMYNALCFDDYEHRGDISVTALIKPPRMRQLEIRFDNDIVEDCSNRVFLLLGSSGHVVLERTGGVNTEVRVEVNVLGWKVTGTVDLSKDDEISDYKFTSVWSIIHGGVKPEWEAQLNLYAFMAPTLVTSLKINAIMRDYSKTKAKTTKDYPTPIVVLDVPLWSHHVQEDYLKERVMLHQAAERLDDDDLPFCTKEERWAKPTVFAVMKKGRKSSFRNLVSREAAEKWMKDNGKGEYIEYRPGVSVRCEDYCLVKNFCNQYRGA